MKILRKNIQVEFLKMWKNGGVNTTLLSKMISFASEAV